MQRETMFESRGVVIFNPTAGRGRGGEMVEGAKHLLGSTFDWVPTMRPGHAIELAREAAKDHPMVVACGGDGTVGDVARGIYGTDATLGIIPVGTGNDVARNLGVPLTLREACATIQDGHVRRVDMGSLNGTPFLNNAGTGFDSRVMLTMNSGIRFLRGRAAFQAAIFKTILTYKPFRMKLTLDDQVLEIPDALMLSVLNGKVYAAGMPAAPDAEVDDGRLDVLLVRNLPSLRRIPLLMALQHGHHKHHPKVQLFQVRRLAFETVPPQPLNIDGEVRGSTPAEILALPAAIKVLVR